jgi:thiol-disulfide isomerase/thioredoxin
MGWGTLPSMAADETPIEPAQRPARLRGARRWGLELLVVLALFMAINAWQTSDLPRGDVARFTLRAIDGGTFDSASLAGKPALLVFWAPWCGVCRAQSQNVSWAQSMAGARVRVVSVAASYRDVADVRAYMAEQDVDYPVLLGNAALARSFGVRAFPTAFYLDAQGKISRATVGYTTTFGLLWRALLFMN